jgi:hypothetical protein
MHDAFISYSRKDAEFARRLKKALEDYRPPRGLAVPQRHLDVFRDEADFTGVDYSKSVGRHLAGSQKLLAVCSPSARASAFVNDEIRHFTQTRGAENIIPLLLSGIPNNEAPEGRDAAFPEALCEALSMPLAVPYRGFEPRRDHIDRGAYAGSWYSLLANLYGLSRAEVEQRERHRRARTRRITAGIAGGVIAALAAALVVSLLFWGRAVADQKRAVAAQKKAEASARAERVAKAKEHTARVAEEEQRKIAVERQKEAERQRAAAQREAVAARRETASRIAVQALEKLDGAPEKALRLAVAAVEGFHRHGDPVVVNAVTALQKVALAFAGSRPVLPWRDGAEPAVLDPRLQWAAASDNRGEVLFAPAGSAAPRPLAAPRGILAPGERWSKAPTKLAFSARRLIAARTAEKIGSGSITRATIWSWPLGDGGIAGEPAVVTTFTPLTPSAVELLPSPDGRWLSWSDGARTVFLRALAGPGETLSGECNWGDCLRAFSPDSRFFFVVRFATVRRFALARDAGSSARRVTELKALETEVGKPIRIATFAYEGPAGSGPDEPAGPVDRLAILGADGDVEWWDAGAAAPARQSLPNVFAAFKGQLEVRGLKPDQIHGDLQWSPDGKTLLVSIAEAAREFGIAAVHELRGESAWHPLAHRYEAKVTQSMSRVLGQLGGDVSGYRVKNAADLGVSAASWVTPEGVCTVGFDGTVFLRELKGATPGRALLIDSRAESARLGGRWIMVGGRDGKLRLVDFKADHDNSEEALVLNGHDAPVREIDMSPDQTRLASFDAAGVARIWSLTHPILQPDGVSVTPDWRWLKAKPERGGAQLWPLGGRDPLSAPVLSREFPGAAAVAWDSARPAAAALYLEPASPLPLVLRLWALEGDRPALVLRRERRFAAGPLGPSFATWQLWLSTSDRQARIAIQRTDGTDSAVWTTDLLDPRSRLRRLGDPDLKVDLKAASPGLRWLQVSSGPRAKPPAAVWLADLGDWKGPPRAVPLDGFEVRYGAPWSPDGRWVFMKDQKGRHALIDLAAAAGSGRAERRVEIGDYPDPVFGRGRPPLHLDGDGNLRAWQERPQGAPRRADLLPGPGLAALSWDDAGEWLALGHRDGRVWLAHPDRAGGAGGLRQQLRAAMLHDPLPTPAEPEARAKIERVFPFPAQGWVVAVTEKHMALLWHRSPEGDWEAPVTFTSSDLRLDGDLYAVQFRPDGHMALFAGQVVSFDPDQLLTQARLLLSGRVP